MNSPPCSGGPGHRGPQNVRHAGALQGGRRSLVLMRGGLFVAAVLSFMALPARAENIRVAIADGLRSVVLRSPEGFIVEGAPGTPTPTMTVTGDSLGKGRLRIRSRGRFIGVNGSSYRGTIEVRRKENGRILVVNDLDIEDYLRGVVAAEIPGEWELEALKVQAVAARTYALFQKRSAGRRPYHILATVDSQVYLGRRAERPRANRALEMTRGEVLLYRGGLVQAFYHSSCGGHTEDALELWGIDAPYLRGVDCDCQSISAYGPWEKRFSTTAVLNALRRDGYRLTSIDAVSSGPLLAGGRVMNVLFHHPEGTTSVPAESLRSLLGYSRVPSIFFEPELVDGEIVFSGRGMGHGVGLCQWGAKDLAMQGYSYRAILAHYYPGTTVGRWEGPGKMRLTMSAPGL